MSKIVLAVDGSENSMRASAMAAAMSRSLTEPVDVINVVSERHVVRPNGIEDYERIEHVLMTQQEILQAFGSEAVGKAAAAVAEAGGEVDRIEVLVGEPAAEIVEYAEGNKADYIVMGRRGLGNMTGLLMGSVSHKVGHLTDLTLVTTR